MVEVVLVLVEAADGDGQVPALTFFGRCIAVQHPLVARGEDGDVACRLQVVYVEGHLGIAVYVVLRDDADAQSLVVELLAGIDLKGLLSDNARPHLDGACSAGERHAVDHEACAVGVRHVGLVEVEVDVSGLRLFALVGDVELEAGRLAVRHAAHALLVHLDLRVLYFLCAHIEHRAGTVELRLALVLPRTAGGTATGAIDEAGGIAEVARLELAVQVVLVVVHLLPEVPTDKQVARTGGRQCFRHRHGPVDVEVQVVLLVHADAETLRAAE